MSSIIDKPSMRRPSGRGGPRVLCAGRTRAVRASESFMFRFFRIVIHWDLLNLEFSFACQTLDQSLVPAFLYSSRGAPGRQAAAGRWFIDNGCPPGWLLTIPGLGEGEGTFGGDPKSIFKNLLFFLTTFFILTPQFWRATHVQVEGANRRPS